MRPMKSFLLETIWPSPRSRGASAVEFAPGDVSLLDAHHPQRLDPVGHDAQFSAGLHQRPRQRGAESAGTESS